MLRRTHAPSLASLARAHPNADGWRHMAIQQWFTEPSDEDRRGLTALFWSNINPYGTFRLEMDKRLDLAPAAAVPRPRTATEDAGFELEIVKQ